MCYVISMLSMAVSMATGTSANRLLINTLLLHLPGIVVCATRSLTILGMMGVGNRDPSEPSYSSVGLCRSDCDLSDGCSGLDLIYLSFLGVLSASRAPY